MNKKIIPIVIGIAGITILGYALRSSLPQQENPMPETQPNGQAKIQVVASFYPLAEVAKNVGSDLVEVTNITPAGAEPHDYEPTPQDILKTYRTQVFIFNGNGVDTWAEKIEGDLKSKNISTIKISDHLDSLKNNAPENNNQRGEAHDPHFWLDPLNVEKEADVVAQALIAIDPGHEKEYTQNRDDFKQQLTDLDLQYQNGLAHCQLREIVTSHNAFNYLAKRYNLTTLYILGLSPDAEPSPKTIADVVDVARKKYITYIFFETLVNPKLAQTIASEIGAKTLVLNPIEGLTDAEIAQGKNYIRVMQDNLINLRTALSCQ